ncbi:MAG: competence protein, partial [Pseudomonadota bacterium]
MRIRGRIEHTLLIQRGNLFPWAPVCLAIGIGLYFGLAEEPGRGFYAALAGLLGVGTLIGWRWPSAWSPLAVALALVAVGAALAGWRA